MSSNLPPFRSAPSPYEAASNGHNIAVRLPGPSPREWIIAAGLFGLTFLTTIYAGIFYEIGDLGLFNTARLLIHRPSLVIYGLPFSITLLLILLAHEFGHFAACRYYGMRCTPPYFLPAPFPIAGTFGAFIKIRSNFLNKRALFDVGIAGPLAGFALTLPALWLGISLSKLVPKTPISPGQLIFGEPLILRLGCALLMGYSPDRHDIIAHPVAMAAWVGLLATSLNLLPIWQLDGGHIAYAVLGGSLHQKLSIVSVIGLIMISFLGWPTPSYLLLGVLLLFMGARMRFYRPPTLFNEAKLGSARLFLGLAALLMLILSFIPIPITLT